MVRCIHKKGGKAWIHEMNKKSHTCPLSQQEVEQLRKNPYIKSATANTVQFTQEFKKLAYDEKFKGKTVSETMQACGIDPEVLGISRVKGFACSLNKKAREGTGFADLREENYRRPAKAETVEQRIHQLENELAYTRQEVEFLKKLQAVNMEAQKKWESKHRQK